MEATAATLERRVRVIPATRKPEELHRDHDGKMRVALMTLIRLRRVTGLLHLPIRQHHRELRLSQRILLMVSGILLQRSRLRSLPI